MWGGEGKVFECVGYFRTCALLGGERAIREGRRAALGALYEIFGKSLFSMKEIPSVAAFSDDELRIFRTLLEKDRLSPRTSSAGRLFDAVSSMLGLCQTHRFEGQAAMQLEFSLEGHLTEEVCPFLMTNQGSLKIFDWEPMIRDILNDLASAVPLGEIACKFHNTLVEVIVKMASLADEKKVFLSGGCFQNKYLLERSVRRLRESGYSPYWHQRIPTHDGGISLGQVVAAMREGVPSCV